MDNGFAQIFGQIVSVRKNIPGNTNFCSQGFVKRDQASLQFDMRRTKPSLLKHTTSFLFIQTIAIVPVFPLRITAYCFLYSRILERILRLVIICHTKTAHVPWVPEGVFSQVKPGALLSAADRQIFAQRSKSRSSPELKSLPTLVNSQLVRLRPVGILNSFIFDLINLFQEFARPH